MECTEFVSVSSIWMCSLGVIYFSPLCAVLRTIRYYLLLGDCQLRLGRLLYSWCGPDIFHLDMINK
jgi:hypothetical protein